MLHVAKASRIGPRGSPGTSFQIARQFRIVTHRHKSNSILDPGNNCLTCLQVLTCLLLPELWAREEAGDHHHLIRSRRQQQQQPRRFQNFPARAQTVDRFNREAFIGTRAEYTATFYGAKIEKFMNFPPFKMSPNECFPN